MGGRDLTAVEAAPAIDLALVVLEAFWIERPLVIHNSEGSIEVATSSGPVSVDTLRVQIPYTLSCHLHRGSLGPDLAL